MIVAETPTSQPRINPDSTASSERVEYIRHNRIRRFCDQPRTYFDPIQLRELADSIQEVGLICPILVKPIVDDPDHDYELVDGERRWLACGMIKLKVMRAIVDPLANADNHFLRSVVSNFGRVGHTPLETARAISRIRDSESMSTLSAGEQIRRIARMCARSEPWVYQHLSLLRLDHSVLARMEPSVPREQRLDFSIAMYMTRLHPEFQKQLADEIVSKGMNLKEARFFVRKMAEEAGAQAGQAKRKRPPVNDYRILERLLQGFHKHIGQFQRLSVDALYLLFRRRNEVDREQTIYFIDQTIHRLQELREKILSTKSMGS